MPKNSIKSVLKNVLPIILPIFLSFITSFSIVYYQVQKEKKLEFYKDFLNEIGEYSDNFLFINSMQYKRLATDLDIALFESYAIDALINIEKINLHKLTNLCIISGIYDKKIASYCNNIVKTIYARIEGGFDLDFTNNYCEDLPDYNKNEIQELLTYKWNNARKFNDIRSSVTLEFIKDTDFCYLVNKKDHNGKYCANGDARCTGVDCIASGMDYLTLLILYSNYQNIIDRIKEQSA